MALGQKQITIIWGNYFDLLHKNSMLSVLIRIASWGRFDEYTQNTNMMK